MWSLVSLVVLANVVLLGTLGFGLRRSGGMAQIFQQSPAAPRGGSLVRASSGFFRVVVCRKLVYHQQCGRYFWPLTGRTMARLLVRRGPTRSALSVAE